MKFINNDSAGLNKQGEGRLIVGEFNLDVDLVIGKTKPNGDCIVAVVEFPDISSDAVSQINRGIANKFGCIMFIYANRGVEFLQMAFGMVVQVISEFITPASEIALNIGPMVGAEYNVLPNRPFGGRQAKFLPSNDVIGCLETGHAPKLVRGDDCLVGVDPPHADNQNEYGDQPRNIFSFIHASIIKAYNTAVNATRRATHYNTPIYGDINV